MSLVLNNQQGETAATTSTIRLLIEESLSLFTKDPYNSEIIMDIENECRECGYVVALTFVR